MNSHNTGKLIAFLRKQNNWTQADLAKQLHISDKTVSKWESGQGFPEIPVLNELTSLLGVTVDFLLNCEDIENYTVYEQMLIDYKAMHRLSERKAEIEQLSEMNIQNSYINESLYTQYNVQKGLRDVNGVGVVAGLTDISEVISKKEVDGVLQPCAGELYYRGYNINDLIANNDINNCNGFEEVVYLLLFNKLPNKTELGNFCNLLSDYRKLPVNFVRDVILKAPNSDIINTMSKSVLTLSSYDADANNTSLDNVLKQCMQLISVFPLLAIYGYQAFRHYKENKSLIIHNPKENLSTAENILRLLRPDKKFTKLESMVLDIALILHAEHGGGNNSTFTTRVVTSSGTDTYSAITAALCSLKGPKHGGANIKVMQMFEDIKANVKDISDIDALSVYLVKILEKKAFDKSGLIYGMGHAIYSVSDPRAEVFKKFVKKLSAEKGMESEYALYNNVEKIATQLISEKRKIYKGVSVNVDFYSGFAYKMLGLPPELYTPMFAVARVAGWSAHRLEELVNAGKIIRPAYQSVSTQKSYVKIDKRD
ncbi:MAG TPA: citrate synthase [Clostridia bacterium]|nr:citrate synthase [Clostridia bacterium]